MPELNAWLVIALIVFGSVVVVGVLAFITYSMASIDGWKVAVSDMAFAIGMVIVIIVGVLCLVFGIGSLVGGVGAT